MQKYHVSVQCICCDLVAADAPDQLQAAVKVEEIDVLVSNAALVYIGAFEKNNLEHHNQMTRPLWRKRPRAYNQ